MKKIFLFMLVSAILIFVCTKVELIRELSLEHKDLNFKLGISMDKTSPYKIIGRLKIINVSAQMVKYGNFQLFLKADKISVRTRVKAKNASPMVDTSLVDLLPGDTLEFFTLWEYGKEIDLNKTVFSLHYADSIKTPSEFD